MVTKRDFFQYMSYMYEEDYKDNETYNTLKKIMKIKDQDQLKELSDLITMTGKQRLAYRHALAANGKEFTPLQVDQYISMIEYALSNMDT